MVPVLERKCRRVARIVTVKANLAPLLSWQTVTRLAGRATSPAYGNGSARMSFISAVRSCSEPLDVHPPLAALGPTKSQRASGGTERSSSCLPSATGTVGHASDTESTRQTY
eukprot:scaffold75118_cov60-Phaeocystis_antarctica.AAC.4